MRTALVIGGSSGLGWELAKLLSEYTENVRVIVTGRTPPEGVIAFRRTDCDNPRLTFEYLSLNQEFVDEDYPPVENFVKRLKRRDLIPDLVIFAAGSHAFGQIDDERKGPTQDPLPGWQTARLLMDVNAWGLAQIVANLLMSFGKIPCLVTITSTSASTPRLNEVYYCLSKAAEEILARSVALDPRVGRSLVIAPGGMKGTNLYRDSEVDTTNFMDVRDVAACILQLIELDTPSLYAHIPRQPVPLIEVKEVIATDELDLNRKWIPWSEPIPIYQPHF